MCVYEWWDAGRSVFGDARYSLRSLLSVLYLEVGKRRQVAPAAITQM